MVIFRICAWAGLLAFALTGCAAKPKTVQCHRMDFDGTSIDIKAEVRNGEVGWFDEIGQWRPIASFGGATWTCHPVEVE